MAARILLLFAATGLFAAAWDSDRPLRVATDGDLVPQLLNRPAHQGPAVSAVPLSKSSANVAISSEFDPGRMTLPASMAPGTYRVIDARGRVGWLSVPGPENLPTPSHTQPAVYTSRSDHGDWFFIRIDPAPMIAAPREDSTGLR